MKGRTLIIALALTLASTTAFSQGTFTLGSQLTTGCPTNFVCYNFAADIPPVAPGVNENKGVLAIRWAATGQAGIVTYHSGTRWYRLVDQRHEHRCPFL